MSLPHNPAARNTPAGDTMSVASFPTTGARTRNVINIAAPGNEGAIARKSTGGDSVDAAPSTATDGFPNFRRQRYLHVLAKNNGTGANFKFKVWLYNSAFGQWAVLAMVSAGTPASAEIELTVPNDKDLYYVFDINGAERIYIQQSDIGSGGSAEVWAGVNSF
jgi:hypothetical protein